MFNISKSRTNMPNFVELKNVWAMFVMTWNFLNLCLYLFNNMYLITIFCQFLDNASRKNLIITDFFFLNLFIPWYILYYFCKLFYPRTILPILYEWINEQGSIFTWRQGIEHFVSTPVRKQHIRKTRNINTY